MAQFIEISVCIFPVIRVKFSPYNMSEFYPHLKYTIERLSEIAFGDS